LHYHERYEIGLCEQGEGLVLCEGKYASLTAGDAMLVPPRAHHYSRSLHRDAPCLCRFVYVRKETLHALLGDGEAAERMEKTAWAIPTVLRPAEHPAAAAAIAHLEAAVGRPVCISLEPYKNFYSAEEEHQDYYLKHPAEFRQELIDSGRLRILN
jgi:hypothetical protein